VLLGLSLAKFCAANQYAPFHEICVHVVIPGFVIAPDQSVPFKLVYNAPDCGVVFPYPNIKYRVCDDVYCKLAAPDTSSLFVETALIYTVFVLNLFAVKLVRDRPATDPSAEKDAPFTDEIYNAPALTSVGTVTVVALI
jgi:hypothetical protein